LQTWIGPFSVCETGPIGFVLKPSPGSSMRLSLLLSLFFLSSGVLQPAGAQEPAPDPGPPNQERGPDRPELKALQEQIKSLQTEIDRLRSEMNSAASPPSPRSAPAPGRAAAGGGSMNPKISLDGLFSAAGSSAPDLQNIETGGHDPNQRGFTVQNVEVALSASVDPYFTGNANIVYQLDRNGESFVELEEAYLTSTSLPWNLQVKGGQFFSPFGRLNPTHPHAWDFADQPLVNGRFLGPDGLRGPGVQISYLLPVPIYLEAIVAIQNGSGETGFSFRNRPDEVLFGRTLIDRPVAHVTDLLIIPRLVGSVDVTETQTAVVGISGAFGPNGSGADTRTAIVGADVYYKWKPLRAESGWPFVGWQTEMMARRYEAGPGGGLSIPENPPIPEEVLRDRGGYTQLLYGFKRPWVAGLRLDYVAGSGGDPALDPLRARRFRLSPNVTYYPSEFSKLRLQYNRDDIQSRDQIVHSLFLQWEFLIGEHGAHKF
ncbi:MAG TPA: hypothetical protein VFA47_11830, partial [Candidatus Manganitrophaceae bacterium]|nr:hypothetical protein [Candidatus Manganitrophaceae bacterium]